MKQKSLGNVYGAYKAIITGMGLTYWMCYNELCGVYDAWISRWGLYRWRKEQKACIMMSTGWDHVLIKNIIVMDILKISILNSESQIFLKNK